MAEEIARLAIAVDSSGAEKAVRSLRELAQQGALTESAVKKTGDAGHALKNVSRESDAAARSMGILASAAKAAIASMSVGEVIRLSDTYQKYTAQLKLATGSAEGFAKAQEDVRRIARLAQADLEGTAVLYARIANGTRELGLSQERIARVTEAVSLALRVSGATAEESASAMLQLSQAFASGALRGEEFNAVNEAAPRLMKALADGMGVAVGAMREMAANGEITAEVMAKSLPGALKELRKEAEQIQTIGGAFTNLRNGILELVGTQSDVTGFSKAVSSGIGLIADNLEVLAVAGVAGLARYTAGIGAAAAATAVKAVQARAAAVEELNLAKAQAAAAAAAVAQTRALTGLTAAMGSQTAAASALQAANARLAAAQAAAGVAGRGLLAVLGGPAGVAIAAGLAAAAFMSFGSSARAASVDLEKLKGSTEEAAEAFRKLEVLSRRAAINALEAELSAAMRASSKAIDDFVSGIEPSRQKGARAVAALRADMSNELKKIVADVGSAGGDVEQAISDLIATWEKSGKISAENARELESFGIAIAKAAGLVKKHADRLGELTSLSRELESATDDLNDSLNNTALAAARAAAGLNTKEWETFIAKAEAAAATVGMTAQQLGEFEARAMGASDAQARLAGVLGGMADTARRLEQATADKDSKAISGAKATLTALAEQEIQLRTNIKYAQEYARFLAMGFNEFEAGKWANMSTVAARAEIVAEVMGRLKTLFDNIATNTAPSKSIASAAERTTKAIQEQIKALQLQAKTVGMTEDQITLYKLATEGATKAQLAGAKAALDSRRQRELELILAEQAIDISNEAIRAAKEEADRNNELAQTFGMSASAIGQLAVARLDHELARAKSAGKDEEEIKRLKALIALRKESAGALLTLEAKERERQQWEDWARDVEQIFQQVGQSLADAIFEGGKNGQQLVKDLFKTLTLRVLVQPVMTGLQGLATRSVGSMLGMTPGVGQQAGLSGNLSSMGWLTNFGGNAGELAQDVGHWLWEKGFEDIGSTLADNAFKIGEFAEIGGDILGYGKAIYSAINGEWGAAAGTAIGTYFGGPVGAFIGSAIGSMVDEMFKGETRYGGSFGLQGGVAQRFGGPSGGSSAAEYQFAQAVLTQATDALTRGFSAAGVDAVLKSLIVAFESSEKGRGGTYSFGELLYGGQELRFGAEGKGLGYGGTNGTIEEMMRNAEVDIWQTVIQGWQAAIDEFPKVMQDMIRNVDADALGLEAAQALAQAFVATAEQANALALVLQSMPFGSTIAATFEYATVLAQAAGGAENAANMLSSFFQNYWSETERAAWLTEQLTERFAELGYTLPRSREEMRDLVQANLALGEAGAQTVASLLSMEAALSTLLPAFDAVTDAFGAQLDGLKALATETNRLLGLRNRAGTALDRIDRALGGVGGFGVAREAELWAALAAGSYEQQIELAGELSSVVTDRLSAEIAASEQLTDAARSVREYVQSLFIGNLSPLTMGEQLGEAARQYSELLAKAQGGDVDAMRSLQGAADAYLQLARDYYASSDAYTKIFGYVTGSLDALGVQAETDAQRQLGISESTLAELESLRSVAERAYGALDRQYAQSLQALQAETALLTSIGADTGRLHDIAGLLAGLPAELAAKLQPFLNRAASGVVGSWYADAGFTDPVGLDYWSGQLQQKPQEQVRKDYLYSMVGDWYRDHLGWMPDTKALEYWTSEIERIGIQAALDDWKHTAGIHGSHRNGLWEVPFDGYRAELHRGETVLPKEEAAQYRANTLNWSQYGQSSALVEEIRALRAEVASLRAERKEGDAKIVGTVAASAQASAREIAEGVAEAVQTNNWRQENQLRYGSAR